MHKLIGEYSFILGFYKKFKDAFGDLVVGNKKIIGCKDLVFKNPMEKNLQCLVLFKYKKNYLKIKSEVLVKE